MTPRWFCTIAAVSTALLVAQGAGAQAPSVNLGACGGFTQTGRLQPEDYRYATQRLKVVEDFHFAANVEALIRPMQKGMTIGSDLDYTLWGYPNHHRALVTLVRLGAREGTDQPRGTQFTIECYFRRAFHIAPDDLVARMIYADYLRTVDRHADALSQLRRVTEEAGDSGITHFNAGLIYLAMGRHEEAVAQALRAQALGFQRPELREALERAGKWPAEQSAPATPAASSSGR